MRNINFPKIVLGVIFVLLLFSVTKVHRDFDEVVINELPSQQKNSETISLFFVGDIMLGRVVENIIERNSFDYPFKNVSEIFTNSVTVGNFEGTIPLKHIYTKPYTFLFSIREEYMHNLATLGFDVVSLANNHSYDFQDSALQNTRSVCLKISLACVGDPHNEASAISSVQNVGEYHIGYLFLNAVGQNIEEEQYQEKLQKLKSESDIVIASIHWGEEYELLHNNTQQTLAHELIDNDVDIIIGHHPHVVQDIEVYNGKPIFYSLGNFVFDQYFSNDVQEGLGVKIHFDGSNPRYELVGFTSIGSPSQPRFMNAAESETLFSRILKNTQYFNVKWVVKG